MGNVGVQATETILIVTHALFFESLLGGGVMFEPVA
jgi:hypothetical protein